MAFRDDSKSTIADVMEFILRLYTETATKSDKAMVPDTYSRPIGIHEIGLLTSCIS